MSKPNYRVIVRFDSDRKVFLGHTPELEHCTAEGATRAEAVAQLEEEINAQLANMLSHGTVPPKSVDEDEFNGAITAKISKTLHRDLAYQARTEGVDIDHLVGEMLAGAMDARRANRGAHRPQGNAHQDGGNRRQGNFNGGRQGNSGVNLDDRANFIEYVRGLENGGYQQRGGGHGGGGHGGGHHAGRRRRGRGGGGGGGYPNQNRGDNRGYGQNAPGGGGGFQPAEARPAAPPSPPSGDAGGGNDSDGNA